ncbi:MAG TPA: haloalkane dehalogenase [Acidimicrobiia bacterium]|nr:haloalkane dehalogenase [Acidimicrobiia bacterium]
MRRTIIATTLATALTLAACSSDGDDTAAEATTTTPPTTIPCPEPELMPGVELGDAELRFTDDCLAFVRTPDEQFEDLDGFPFAPNYTTVDGLRVHYVDEGPEDGEVVLMLHGEPSWSYLYRDMIPAIADAGYRVIVPDLVGMGRSDKPVEQDAYSYLQHVEWVKELLDALELDDVTVVVQDWGSLIGLRVVGDLPDRFARVVIANGRLPVVPEGFRPATLPDPPVLDPDLELPFAQPCDLPGLGCFGKWATYALTSPNLRASEVVERLTATELSPAEEAAYDAPFPSLAYMTGPRVFPSLINTLGEAPTNQAAREVFLAWEKPLLTVFGRLDPNLGSEVVQAEMRDYVPGAEGQEHHAYTDAHHFIQEDKGADLARRIVEFLDANPLS